MNQISTKDTLYAVDTTRKFNKQLKKINKQGKNLKKLSLIVEKLANRARTKIYKSQYKRQ